MTGRNPVRTPGWQARALIAMTLLALLLVALVPAALLVAVVMMILGHIVGGLAVFGGSVFAAVVAIALAGTTGMHRLRKLLSTGSFNIVQLDPTQPAGASEPGGSDYTGVVQLDRSKYSDVP